MEHPLNLASFLPADIQAKYLHVIMLTIGVVIILIIGLLAKSMRSEVPSKTQSFFELLVSGVYKIGDDIMGVEGRPYVPLIFGIGFYVAVSSLMGLVPGLAAPAANMNTTVAPAICVFLFYNYIGIKKHGVHYVKHFMGPVLWLAPFMIIIEIIGHFARPLSLTMRLFGNIAGEDLVIAILFFLVPFLLPLPMYFIGIFTCLLQSYVFMMLTMVYISGALEEAH